MKTPDAGKIASKLTQLGELNTRAQALQKELESQRAEIMKRVQKDIDALEKRYAPQLKELRATAAQFEADVKTEVALHGESVKTELVQAVFSKGRMTWNSKALDAYSADHPDINQFRQVGKPVIQLRFKGGSALRVAESPANEDEA